MGRESDEIFERVRKNLGTLSDQSEKDLAEMNQSWIDLKESIEGVSNAIEASFAPALGDAYKQLAEFAKQHPYIALIAGSFASMSGSILQMAGGLAILKGIFGGGKGAAAKAATPAAAAAGGMGLLGRLALSVRARGRAQRRSGNDPGHYLGGSGFNALRRLWGGESGEPGGAFSELKNQAAVAKGSKEGVLAAFREWFGVSAPRPPRVLAFFPTPGRHGRRALMGRAGEHFSPEGMEYRPQLPGHTAWHGAKGGGRSATGALRANQAEAYKAAIAAGYSPDAAKALVADLSGESLANPADVHSDPSRSNRSRRQFVKRESGWASTRALGNTHR
jgi:hypothetical protein